MLLLCLGTRVGVTDCHSQCTHWLRNDTGSRMGCGGAGDRKGRPYEGERTPLKYLAEFAARRRQNYARGRLGAFWQKKSEIFRQRRQKGCPGSGQPI